MITIFGSHLTKVRRVAMARCPDSTKPYLSGVQIEPHDKDHLVAVASDGFLLSWTTVKVPDHGITEARLVPACVCAFLARGPIHKDARLLITDEGFMFSPRGAGIVYYADNLSAPGSYPNWRKVIPRSSDLRPAKPGEVLLGSSVRERAHAIFNGFQKYKTNEVSTAAMIDTKNGVIFAGRDEVFLAAPPVRYSDGSPDTRAVAEAIDALHMVPS